MFSIHGGETSSKSLKMSEVSHTNFTTLRLLLKILLLSAIVSANLGTAYPMESVNVTVSPRSGSTSSSNPVLGSTPDAASDLISAAHVAVDLVAVLVPKSSVEASGDALADIYDYSLNDGRMNNGITNSGSTNRLLYLSSSSPSSIFPATLSTTSTHPLFATSSRYPEKGEKDGGELYTFTASTSVEQQDQPVIPSTTLSFASVSSDGSSTKMVDDIGSSSKIPDYSHGVTSVTMDYGSPPFEAGDDHYVPSQPLNLTVLDVTATSITMSWLPPKNQNGAITGYHVFHIHENQTGVAIVKNTRNLADSIITFVLPNLKPFTEYRVTVQALTTGKRGNPSDKIVQRTDVSGPSAPIIVNVTCNSQDSITIRWKRPYEYYNTIDFYIIKTRLQGQDSHRDIRINASAKELETAMILQNLTTNSVYEVKVAAATFSIINRKKIVLGKFSEVKKIPLHPNCEKIQPLLRQSHNDYNLAVLVGIIFSCFGIVLIVMAFFLWSRKCFHAAYYYLDDPPHHPNVPQVDWEIPVEVGGEIRAAVPVNEFAKHVASLHADGDIGFSREYEAIQNECVTDGMPCEHSQHPENKRKNRYLNITAYDHSRVHLHPIPGQKKNLDYINANFIDGYQKPRAFIGTQGPLPDTFDCFWRMIWEQRVVIIVMITNLVERGRRKCDMYWPKDGTETYGVIQVKLVEEEVMSTYTVRTLQIKHLKLKKKKQCNMEKIVYQYHYTNWPDHGTPDHPLTVLNFVKKSSAANPTDAGPIVVHCSAGVGRTGTYIVLDAMLKQIQHKGVVNVFGFLRHIRIQRNFLVQTEEQYIFLHDALVEAIASGETNLRTDQIEELKNCTPYLENQYKNIIQFQTKDIHIASAMKQVNSIKNRGAIFPIEGSRVHLTPKPGEEGSDYINASWLHGFRRLRDFIVTQHPMAHTVKDFWQMVWDHNAQTIVLLSSLDDINFAQFWPDDTTPIESDYYRVKFRSKTNKKDYVSRDFVIQSIQDDYELNVKMLHCPSWPEMSNPNSIYEFIVDVHERFDDYRNGPIVVVDRYGGAQACTFCAISSLSIEIEYCNTANVYQYAKLYHNKRPGVWTSSEDIRLIYNILSYLPDNLQLLKCTALRTEFEDVTTATPDLYSKICSNGNVTHTVVTNNLNNISDNASTCKNAIKCSQENHNSFSNNHASSPLEQSQPQFHLPPSEPQSPPPLPSPPLPPFYGESQLHASPSSRKSIKASPSPPSQIKLESRSPSQSATQTQTHPQSQSPKLLQQSQEPLSPQLKQSQQLKQQQQQQRKQQHESLNTTINFNVNHLTTNAASNDGNNGDWTHAMSSDDAQQQLHVMMLPNHENRMTEQLLHHHHYHPQQQQQQRNSQTQQQQSSCIIPTNIEKCFNDENALLLPLAVYDTASQLKSPSPSQQNTTTTIAPPTPPPIPSLPPLPLTPPPSLIFKSSSSSSILPSIILNAPTSSFDDMEPSSIDDGDGDIAIIGSLDTNSNPSAPSTPLNGDGYMPLLPSNTNTSSSSTSSTSSTSSSTSSCCSSSSCTPYTKPIIAVSLAATNSSSITAPAIAKNVNDNAINLTAVTDAQSLDIVG